MIIKLIIFFLTYINGYNFIITQEEKNLILTNDKNYSYVVKPNIIMNPTQYFKETEGSIFLFPKPPNIIIKHGLFRYFILPYGFVNLVCFLFIIGFNVYVQISKEKSHDNTQDNTESDNTTSSSITIVNQIITCFFFSFIIKFIHYLVVFLWNRNKKFIDFQENKCLYWSINPTFIQNKKKKFIYNYGIYIFYGLLFIFNIIISIFINQTIHNKEKKTGYKTDHPLVIFTLLTIFIGLDAVFLYLFFELLNLKKIYITEIFMDRFDVIPMKNILLIRYERPMNNKEKDLFYNNTNDFLSSSFNVIFNQEYEDLYNQNYDQYFYPNMEKDTAIYVWEKSEDKLFINDLE